MDLTRVITTVWPLDDVASVEPLRGGINNRTFRIRSEAGDSYVYTDSS